MKPALLGGLLVTAFTAALAVNACTVHSRSGDLVCTTTADCTAPRTCLEGYCVLDGSGSGIGTCPSTCTSCDLTASPPLCTIQGGGSITCPAGMRCVIACDTASGCGDIDCTNAASCAVSCDATSACGNIDCGAASCTILCSGSSACGDVECGAGGSGQCAITCTGSSACGNVTCSNACACDVNGCTSSGECGDLSCPKGMANTFCTASGSDNEPCISTLPACNKC